MPDLPTFNSVEERQEAKKLTLHLGYFLSLVLVKVLQDTLLLGIPKIKILFG